jgi:hypothetical protein
MQNTEKSAISITTLFGALAGIVTITTGLLFYTGYLFLLGFYRGFGIQIEMLELSAQEILIESGAILIPTLFFTVLLFMVLSFLYARFFAKSSLSQLLQRQRRPIYLGLLIYLLLFTWTIPVVGEWVAKSQIDQQLTIYAFLTKTLPNSTVYADELLPSLTPTETNEGVYTYEDLRFLASTDDYFFFFKSHGGTYIIPSSSIVLVTFHR